MNIDMLDTSTGTAEPCHHVLGRSTAISIFYLPLLSTSWILVAWSVPTFGCLLTALWEIKVRPVGPGVSTRVAGDQPSARADNFPPPALLAARCSNSVARQTHDWWQRPVRPLLLRFNNIESSWPSSNCFIQFYNIWNNKFTVYEIFDTLRHGGTWRKGEWVMCNIYFSWHESVVLWMTLVCCRYDRNFAGYDLICMRSIDSSFQMSKYMFAAHLFITFSSCMLTVKMPTHHVSKSVQTKG